MWTKAFTSYTLCFDFAMRRRSNTRSYTRDRIRRAMKFKLDGKEVQRCKEKENDDGLTNASRIWKALLCWLKEVRRIARAFNRRPIGPSGECSSDLIHARSEVGWRWKYIVVVDRFSKYGTFIASPPNVTVDDTAKLFFKNVVKYWGVPHVIVSDRDPRFAGRFWTELFKIMLTDLNFSTSFHPQKDRQTERVNALLEIYLRTMAAKKEKKNSAMKGETRRDSRSRDQVTRSSFLLPSTIQVAEEIHKEIHNGGRPPERREHVLSGAQPTVVTCLLRRFEKVERDFVRIVNELKTRSAEAIKSTSSSEDRQGVLGKLYERHWKLGNLEASYRRLKNTSTLEIKPIVYP
ncbi:putative nucleotidyltransferase, ribonuclease H [Tanacetum coccineum]